MVSARDVRGKPRTQGTKNYYDAKVIMGEDGLLRFLQVC